MLLLSNIPAALSPVSPLRLEPDVTKPLASAIAVAEISLYVLENLRLST